MSEYQYYEFRAIDQALTQEQMKEVRGLSSRAEITPRSFTNTYNYGDFGGNPRRLMERYYDAHVYVSNFGSLHFMLRLPRNVISEKTLAPYRSADTLDFWTTDEHTILDWELNEDGGGDWMDGEGWMDRLLSLRDELVRQDYRSLYIGWLSSFAGGSSKEEDDEEDDEDPDDEDWEENEDEDDFVPYSRRKEPPVPAGLGSLSAAQSALAEFLGVRKDLIRVAAEASPKAPAQADAAKKVSEWVAELPEREIRTLIERVVNGEGTRVQTELQSRFFRSGNEGSERSQGKVTQSRRTAADLLKLAEQAEQNRKQQEQSERDRKRHAFVAGLVPRLPELWTKVIALVEEQKAVPYDQACALLVDMRAAYSQADRLPEFDAEFAKFLAKYSRSTALVRRFKQAKLFS